MAKQKEREEFLSVLAQEEQRAEMSLPELLRLGRLLMRHAATHGRLQEETCNIEMTERQEKRHEAKEAQIEKRLTAVYRMIFPGGKGIDFGGDPRGYTVKIFLPSERSNTWGGKESGWGIPQ